MEATSDHYSTLRDRHHTLDKAIAAEMKRPIQDSMKISDLKKQKLALKEQMEGLQPSA